MRRGLLTGLTLLVFFTAGAQDGRLKVLLDSAGFMWYTDFEKTRQLVKQAEQLIDAGKLDRHAKELVNFYDLRIQSCNAFFQLKLWRQYIDELQRFLDGNKNLFSPGEYHQFNLRNRFSEAQYLNRIGNKTKAQDLFAELLVAYKKLPESREVCGTMAALSNDMAEIHAANGEYEAAINQYLANIKYSECLTNGAPDFSVIYRNIGTTYLKKKDYEQAARYLRRAEVSVQARLKGDPLGGARVALSLYETLASYYEQTGSHDSAMVSMQKAMPLLKLTNIDNTFKGRINLSLGDLYFRERKFTAALDHYDQAEKYFSNSAEDAEIYLSNLYLSEAGLYERMGMPDKALQHCSMAMARLVINFKADADENPALNEILSKKQLFAALQKKSLLLEKMFIRTREIKILISAFHTNQLSLALLDSTANEVSLDNDKINLAEESYNAFEDGIRMAFALYEQTSDAQYLSKCFSMMDKSKGMVLLERLRLVDQFAGINPELVNREKEIKSELLLTEQHLYELETKNQTADLAATRGRYANLKHDYAGLMNRIKSEAPDYYRLRFDHGVVNVQEIQAELLQKNEVILEYFVGDSILGVAGLTASHQFLSIKSLPADFTSTIQRLRTLITGDESNRQKEFEKLTSGLYDFLIKDALRELGGDMQALTVIPDGVLGYLPFEVLQKQEGGKTTFLAEDFSVRYAYSATYLHEQRQKKTAQADHFFGGFVSSGNPPDISFDRSSRKTLGSLPGAEKEVTAITELLGNSCSVFSPAHKSDFKEHASDYQVLHLAMHSQVNNENPMLSVLSFSAVAGDTTDANELTAIELYNMSLKSDLAVLSACNTGFGTLHRGEGIMSFSRAFAYAGVPSAVISLWQVPDKATSKIMVNFYKHLKEGESKDRALQQAKLDFIRDYPQMSAPYYWAGFILTGSKEPLDFPSSMWWYWVIASILVAALAAVAIRRFRGASPHDR